MPLEAIELVRGNDPTHCVIWLHGLGADGHDFESVVPELNLDLAVRFILPHAPIRPVTLNGGMQMRAWYDINPGDVRSGADEIRESALLIHELVENETARGIPSSRIALAGFSQGGVVALQLAVRAEQPFAGVVALSTYLHNHENVGDEVSFASVNTPIFMAHGTLDPMIPLSRAVSSRNALEALNYNVEWRQYDMAHQVCYDEIADISAFLNLIFMRKT